MGKRRTYEERWHQKWYRTLSPIAKLIYGYIYDNVDWAGFIEYDLERFEFETKLTAEEIEGAIKELDSCLLGASKGVLWLFDYINLQGNLPLNESNKAHINIIRALDAQAHIFEGVESFKAIRGLEGASKPPCNVMYSNVKSNKESKEESEEEREKAAELFDDAYRSDFERARKAYPGTKRGFDTEFDNFKKKHKDWKKVITMLAPAIENQIAARALKKEKNVFVPEWKNFQTWINQRCWEEEAGIEKQVLAVGN